MVVFENGDKASKEYRRFKIRTKNTPAVEILINTPGVASTIREGKIHLIDNQIETGEEQGMLLFEKYLLRLYQQGQISKESAISYALRPAEIMKFIK
jgi:twitching motility protein PilT